MDGGLVRTLVMRIGQKNGRGDIINSMLNDTDAAVEKLPKVSGSNGELYPSSEVSAVLRFAEKAAAGMKDEYISVEHIMLGLLSEGGRAVRDICARRASRMSLRKSKPLP